VLLTGAQLARTVRCTEHTSSVNSGPPNELEALRFFIDAHDQPDPRTGAREPIWYLRFHGDLMHHALPDERPSIDEALIEEMQAKGLISVEHGGRDGNTWKITPTTFGRHVAAEDERMRADPAADTTALVAALERQANASSALAWPAVRPILSALNGYWRESGFPAEGVSLMPIAAALSDEYVPLFTATIRSLVSGAYLEAGHLVSTITDESGRKAQIPAEVAFTEKAHAVLDGWPGAAPSELVENLLAVLAAEAANEPDPTRRRRIEGFAAAVKDVGVTVAGDVIAKVITGGV
jgi:hypothetical protein